MNKKMENLAILATIIIILTVGFFLYDLSQLRMAPPRQCYFPARLTCITNKLSANNGRLTLQIGQGTGHQIRINGVTCTQNTSSDFSDKTFISYGHNKNVTMESGSSATLATPEDVQRPWLNISCTDADGSIPQDTTVGAKYNGKIYINYTELDTGIQRIAVGSFRDSYEA